MKGKVLHGGTGVYLGWMDEDFTLRISEHVREQQQLSKPEGEPAGLPPAGGIVKQNSNRH